MIQQRVAFANQLRGVAALSVLVIHYTVVFQLMRPTVSWVVAAPPIDGPVPAVALALQPGWFDGGAFGVALFFLISGFVIPFSLAGTTRLRFLVSRALRIYPTFWLALATEWLLIGASGAYWGRPIVFGWPTFLRSALLVNTLFDGITVDLVSWTLSIEVKFYLLMALLQRSVLAARLWPLIATGGALLAVTVTLGERLPSLLTQEAMYLAYMLVGTVFHYHHRRAIGVVGLWGGGSLLVVAAALCWRLGPAADLWPMKPANYAYALGVFALAYRLRGWFGRSTVLDGLAAISYPLYLVHSLIGFTTMSFLMGTGVAGYPAALAAGLGLTLLVAVGLHVTVERASIRLGRQIGRDGRRDIRLGRPQAGDVATPRSVEP